MNNFTITIYFLNKKKNYQKDTKEFTGKDAMEKATKWGRKNLHNFNSDMLHINFN
jgi:hypothetical protein